MDEVEYTNAAASLLNQKLGGKEVRFPTSGISCRISSSRLGSIYTPSALNVIFNSPYNADYCGGTRPGLKAFTGTQPSSNNSGLWLWPNGEPIMWNENDRMSFHTFGTKVVMPDGKPMFIPHESFDITATKGAIPSDCSIMSVYRDRAIVAKGAMWYASRTGDHGDFDYGGDIDDSTKAVAGNVAYAGKNGEAITALAAIKDSYLIVATERSLWCVNGEPTVANGNIHDNVGIVSKDAWCWDGSVFWFIDYNGMYAMRFGEQPAFMSINVYDDFKGWKSAVMVYDAERNGIHIFGTKQNNSVADWFYDIPNKAFWRMSYPAVKRPVYGGSAMIEGVNRVVFYCFDGVFRYWDDGQNTDDGISIRSYVSLAPVVHTTGGTENAFLAELDFDMNIDGASGYGANISGIVGNVSQDVLIKTKNFTDWIDGGSSGNAPDEEFRYRAYSGWNKVVRPRVRCNSFSCVIWDTNGKWEFSKITAAHRGCGRIRR